jgi:peptide/nickel transport system substrate-binding protein
MSTDRPIHTITSARKLSRRSFAKSLAVAGLAVPTLAGLLAACGDDETTDDDAAEPAAADDDEDEDEEETPDDVEDEEADSPDDDERDEETSDEQRDHLQVGWLGDFLDLDPSQMRDTLDTELGYKIYSSLVLLETGSADALKPDLAESWEVSDDATEFSFSLVEGAQWHKGYGNVTASDVERSLMRHHDEAVATRYAAEAEPIEAVEVEDDHHLRVIMNQPYPAFLIEFCAYRPGFIVNQEAMDERGDRYGEDPVGSGPYYLDNWSPNDRTEIVRFDDYYGEAPFFRTITYSIIPQETTQEIALERGEIEIGYFMTPEVQNRIINHDHLEVDVITGPRTWYLQMNQEREPWNDVRVRQALWYAIDKDSLVNDVLNGQGTPTDTLLNPFVFGRLDERVYDYDPDRARELLAEAGYPDGFDFDFLNYEGGLNDDLSVALQAMWQMVGLNGNIQIYEWAQQVEIRREGNYDVALQPQLRLGPDQYFSPLMHSANIPYPNASRHSDPEADELIEAARREADDDRREELYHDLQRMLHETVPVIPLFHPVFVLGYQPYITNARAGNITLNPEIAAE